MKEDVFGNQTNEQKDFWERKWQSKETGWDIGYPSPPLAEYMLQYPNKDAKILIPGCGNSYETDYLQKLGFKNITVLDIAPEAVSILNKKYGDQDEITIICGDFFQHEGNYDLILEQTFFCAIPPVLRSRYAEKAAELLNQGGKLAGVLFNRNFEKIGPPFGGTTAEYEIIFKKYFTVQKIEMCNNSIYQREGSEIFINLNKK